MSPLEYWFRTGDRLKRHGRPDRAPTGGMLDPDIPPVSDRDALVYGTYEPNANNTGVIPGTALIPWEKTAVNTNTFEVDSSFNGQTIMNRIIYGDITVTATGDVTFRNCRFVGGNHQATVDTGIVYGQQQRGGTGVVKLIDCTIEARKPALNRDGVRGVRLQVERCNISKVIDGMGFFVETKYNKTTVDVIAQGNYVHDLVYFYPDYKNGTSGAVWHSDGTHNDGVQIQGGANILIKGNTFEQTGFKGVGSLDNPGKPWMHTIGHAAGSGTIIQRNGACAPLANVVVEENYYSHGLCHIQMQPGTYTVRNNKHSRVTAKKPVGATGETWNGVWNIVTEPTNAATQISGVTTGTPSNKWKDDGTLLVSPRSGGLSLGW